MKTYILMLFLCGLSVARAQDSISVSAKTYVAELEKTIAGRENEPSENVFKNIQSLKGIPAGRLLKIMQSGFSKSLGVDCSHCHNPKAWDSDEKEKKEIARKMWTLSGTIRKEITSITNTRAVVNCFTCHRGKTEPAF